MAQIIEFLPPLNIPQKEELITFLALESGGSFTYKKDTPGTHYHIKQGQEYLFNGKENVSEIASDSNINLLYADHTKTKLDSLSLIQARDGAAKAILKSLNNSNFGECGYFGLPENISASLDDYGVSLNVFDTKETLNSLLSSNELSLALAVLNQSERSSLDKKAFLKNVFSAIDSMGLTFFEPKKTPRISRSVGQPFRSKEVPNVLTNFDKLKNAFLTLAEASIKDGKGWYEYSKHVHKMSYIRNISLSVGEKTPKTLPPEFLHPKILGLLRKTYLLLESGDPDKAKHSLNQINASEIPLNRSYVSETNDSWISEKLSQRVDFLEDLMNERLERLSKHGIDDFTKYENSIRELFAESKLNILTVLGELNPAKNIGYSMNEIQLFVGPGLYSPDNNIRRDTYNSVISMSNKIKSFKARASNQVSETLSKSQELVSLYNEVVEHFKGTGVDTRSFDIQNVLGVSLPLGGSFPIQNFEQLKNSYIHELTHQINVLGKELIQLHYKRNVDLLTEAGNKDPKWKVAAQRISVAAYSQGSKEDKGIDIEFKKAKELLSAGKLLEEFSLLASQDVPSLKAEVVEKKEEKKNVSPEEKKEELSDGFGSRAQMLAKKKGSAPKPSYMIEKTVTEKPAPVKVAPKKKTSAKVAPEKQVPAKVAPKKPAPAKVAPEKQAPVKVAPEKQAPVKVAPEKQAPAKVAPEKQAPAKVAPEKQAPAKVAPEKPATAKVAPEKPATAKVAPEKQAPAKVGAEKQAPAKVGSEIEITEEKPTNVLQETKTKESLIDEINDIYERITDLPFKNDELEMPDELEWIEKRWSQVVPSNLTSLQKESLEELALDIKESFGPIENSKSKRALSQWYLKSVDVGVLRNKMYDLLDKVKELNKGVLPPFIESYISPVIKINHVIPEDVNLDLLRDKNQHLTKGLIGISGDQKLFDSLLDLHEKIPKLASEFMSISDNHEEIINNHWHYIWGNVNILSFDDVSEAMEKTNAFKNDEELVENMLSIEHEVTPLPNLLSIAANNEVNYMKSRTSEHPVESSEELSRGVSRRV